MAFTVELVGGPADGEIRVLSSDRRALRLIMPLNLSPDKAISEDEMGPPARMETIEVTYLRTKRTSAAGHRIYQYML